MFYLLCRNNIERTKLIKHLKKNIIHSVFHYVCLHDSPYFKEKHDKREMPNVKIFEDCLLDFLPDMKEKQTSKTVSRTTDFTNKYLLFL